MDRTLFLLGETPVTLEMAMYAVLGAFAVLLGILIVMVVRQSRQRAEEAALTAMRAREAERQLADLMRIQSEMTGRMQTMSEIFGSRTSDLPGWSMSGSTARASGWAPPCRRARRRPARASPSSRSGWP